MGCGGSNAAAVDGPKANGPAASASTPATKQVPVAWAEEGTDIWQKPPSAAEAFPPRFVDVKVKPPSASPRQRRQWDSDIDGAAWATACPLREAAVANPAPPPRLPLCENMIAQAPPSASSACSAASTVSSPSHQRQNHAVIAEIETERGGVTPDEDANLVDLYDDQEEIMEHAVTSEIEGMMIEMEIALIKKNSVEMIGRPGVSGKIYPPLEKRYGHGQTTTQDDELLMAEILDDDCLT